MKVEDSPSEAGSVTTGRESAEEIEAEVDASGNESRDES